MALPPSGFPLRPFQPFEMHRNTSLLTDEGFTEESQVDQMGSVQGREGGYQYHYSFMTMVRIFKQNWPTSF